MRGCSKTYLTCSAADNQSVTVVAVPNCEACIMPFFVVESDRHDFFNKFHISVYVVAWTPVEIDRYKF